MAQYFENANLPSKIIEFEAYFLKTKFIFKSDNGVFSKEKLDFGTRLLLENLPIKEMSGDVLDLGCGYGAWNCNNAPAFVKETSYWLGSANSTYSVWDVHSSGNFRTYDWNSDSSFGVRPVIVI